jgi:transcriptional regulator with XRE-family HTH domain
MTMTDELSARAIHERHMRESLEYRREYERTRFANDVALRVVKYRAEHGLSQTALAKLLGMHQSAIARLEAGEHEPSLTMLSRLAQVLGEDFSVDIKPDRVELRSAGLSCTRLGRRRARVTAACRHPHPAVDDLHRPSRLLGRATPPPRAHRSRDFAGIPNRRRSGLPGRVEQCLTLCAAQPFLPGDP